VSDTTQCIVSGAFEKLLKATINFVTSLRMEQLDSQWTGFNEI